MGISISHKGISAKPKWKDLKGLGKAPPAGLSPIGDSGWYATPDEPADPRDCDRYPDSPWCGGNPIDTKTPIGIGIDFGLSKCGFHVSAKPTLGYVKLPPASIAYIDPDCRDEYERKPKPPPLPGLHAYHPPPPNYQGMDDEADVVMSVLSRAYFFGSYSNNWSATEIYSPVRRQKFEYPPVTQTTQRERLNFNNEVTGLQQSGGSRVLGKPLFRWDSERVWEDGSKKWFHLLDDDFLWKYNLEGDENLLFADYGTGGHFLIAGKIGAIKKIKFLANGTYLMSPQVVIPGYWTIWREIEYVMPRTSEEDFKRKYPPPIIDYQKRKCCVSCCPQNSNQANRNQADNREILRLLKEIRKYQGNYPQKLEIFDANEDKQGAQKKTLTINNSAEFHKLNGEQVQKSLKMIGIDIFPLKLPKTIVEKKGGNIFEKALDFLNPFDNEEINSLAEWQVWYTKQFNAVMGQWMEEIQVEDADPEKKGNQRETVVLPNIAMTMKEQIMMQASSMKVLGLIFDMFLKTMVELAGIKAKSAEACAQIQEIVDFLDYPTNQKSIDVPVQITIPKPDATRDEINNIEKFLKNSTIKVIYDDWTGEGSLHDFLLDLSQMAASQRAQNAAL